MLSSSLILSLSVCLFYFWSPPQNPKSSMGYILEFKRIERKSWPNWVSNTPTLTPAMESVPLIFGQICSPLKQSYFLDTGTGGCSLAPSFWSFEVINQPWLCVAKLRVSLRAITLNVSTASCSVFMLNWLYIPFLSVFLSCINFGHAYQLADFGRDQCRGAVCMFW